MSGPPIRAVGRLQEPCFLSTAGETDPTMFRRPSCHVYPPQPTLLGQALPCDGTGRPWQCPCLEGRAEAETSSQDRL